MNNKYHQYYLRKYDPQCDKQISITNDIVKNFFGVKNLPKKGGQDIKLIYKQTEEVFDADMSGATDPRFLSKLKIFFKNNNNELHVEDILMFDKFQNEISVDVIKPADPKYKTLFSLFCSERHVLINTENDLKEDTETSSKANIPYQQVFYGAPGTGKSTAVKQIVESNEMVLYRTTFHPESDYFSFFGSYKPSTEQTTGKITYKFTPQIFLKAYLFAWEHPEENVCLDIEEINRGNCAQIFGDIFQLLDREPSGFSSYTVDADDDCGIYIENELKKLNQTDNENKILKYYKETICQIGKIDPSKFSFTKLLLPNNLYIFATMNTSDQSLYPMDSAFKRRWNWKYIPIDYEKVQDRFISVNGKKYSWSDFLTNVNRRIEDITQSEDKKLGQFFISQDSAEISADNFRDKVLFYLWNDIFKDEYGTGSTIFKTCSRTDEDSSTFFSFSDLFTEKSYDLIENIMMNLDVKTISESSDLSEKSDESNYDSESLN